MDEKQMDLNTLEKHLQRKERKLEIQRIFFLLSLALLIGGVFFAIYPESFLDSRYSNERELVYISKNIRLLAGTSILFSTVIFAYLYMSGFSIQKIHNSSFYEDAEQISNSKNYLDLIGVLKSIEKSIEKGKLESVLSQQERDEIIKQISNTVEKQLNKSLLNTIEEKYGKKIYNNKLSNKANELLSKTIKRLECEVEKLQSKATVNLIYGIGSTIIAIGILIFLLFNVDIPKETEQVGTIFYYFSRFFLVLLVQGISIFFLRLYKATLNDLMYLNNEITNYEAKRDALTLAFNHNKSEKVTNNILDNLSNTERNFILKKDESSIFNKSKNTNTDLVDINILKELLSKVKKEK